jgi:hypothetical protein
MGEHCDHPADKVQLVDTDALEDEGEPVPQFWTILGECECGELVEVDYTFHTISEV